MKNKNILTFILLLASVTSLLFPACKKDNVSDDNPVVTILPRLNIELDHLAGNQKFYFDSTYTTGNGDQITADIFKYYISNITLVGINNQEYKVPESYFLVDHSKQESLRLKLSELPAGSFKSIKFMIGVDSTRCVSGAQTGALDPVNGMFWTWNTGYIFLKLEGTSPAIPSNDFIYHIGGFKGSNVNNKVVELSFDGDILTLQNNTNPEVHLVVDILEIFENPNTIDLSSFANSVTIPNASANMIAENYVNMIRYDHIHAD